MMIDTQFTYRSRSLADATGDEARPLYSATTSDGTQTGNCIVSDLAIVYDFGVEDDTRFADCDVTPDAPTCTQASTYSTVQAYAAVIYLTISTFTSVCPYGGISICLFRPT